MASFLKCESSSKVRKSRARSLDSLSPVGRASKKRKGDSLPPELETQKTDLTGLNLFLD